MATYTNNLNLPRPEGTDNFTRNSYNQLIDTIDSNCASKDNFNNYVSYPTAGGTATAITLTLPTLVNGLSKTFIASEDNNGSETTINTKPLYKPNSTIAPVLTSGKAYTIWYNLSSDCFFIKVSEGGDSKPANLIRNGNFGYSTNCWDSSNVTNLSVTNNVISFLPTAQYGLVQQAVSITTGHKYYICGYVQTSGGAGSCSLDFQRITAPSPVLCVTYNTISNSMEFLSVIGTATETANNYTVRVMDMRSSGWTTVSAKEIMCFDLTDRYGAGNEPTKAEMDAIVKVKGWWNSDLQLLTFNATATASKILSTDNAYVNGQLITGTIPSKTTATYNPSTSVQTITSGQYLSGTQTISAVTGTATADKVDAGYTFSSANGINLTGTSTKKKWAYAYATSLGNISTFTVTGLGFTPSCIIIRCLTTVSSNAYEIVSEYCSGIVQNVATYARIRDESYAPEGNYGSYYAKIPTWSVGSGTFSFSVSGYTFFEAKYWAFE